MKLPDWLEENSPALCPCGCLGGRKKQGFVQKTLEDIVRFLHDSVFSEEVALQTGFLQSLDPRVKVAALLLLLISLNLLSHLTLLWGFYLVLLLAAHLSGLSVRSLLKRVWLVVPLFTGIMALPALFNWVRPGDPLLTLFHLGAPLYIGPWRLPATLTITEQGLRGDALLVSRVGISVTLAMIITLTTRWHDLLRALRSFFLPKIFVATLEMTYRYIFVLVMSLEEMFMARKARDAGLSDIKEQRRFVASSIGGLFGKSQLMSEEIYQAMIARGYNGEVRLSRHFKLTWLDLFTTGVILLSSLTLYAADKVLGG
ncbi:nickel transport protein NikQ [Peptococcaceae bacterium CEB3]|nr:nickel transport protein NikQ [Peptococcaceae bacterium CEB3]